MSELMDVTPNESLSVLIFAIGTAGDVYPNIAVGKALRLRGHKVLVAANSYFEPAIRRANLDFFSMGDVDEYLRVTADPDLWQWGKGFKILLREMARQMRPVYEMVVQQASEARALGDRFLVIAPASALGARLANEKLGVPLVTLHLQPIFIRSSEARSGTSLPFYLKPLVRPLRKTMHSALDRWLLHPLLLPQLNEFRAELGLAPLERIFGQWIHSPGMTIGLFPEWFASRQPDWPLQLRQTGFPLYDDSTGESMPREVEEFLGAGDPPIVFAPGSGMQFAKPFFEASAEVCRLLGRRGILLTRFADQIPSALPDGVRHFPFVSHSLLLPRAAALVHHGGIGTLAAACRAGIPQLICPCNFDQPDNAGRLRALGTGDVIRPRAYRPQAVAHKLAQLLASSDVAERCRLVAAKFGESNPVEETCKLVESAASLAELAGAKT